MIPKKYNFTVYQGATLNLPIRWESDTVQYREISAIAKSAPAVVTAAAHNIPDGWWVAVTDCLGMTQINATNPPKDAEYLQATVLSSSQFSLNKVDAKSYTAYTSNGIVRYNEPIDLTGYTARMKLRASVTSTTVIDAFTDTDSRLPDTGIVIDTANYLITLLVDATVTAAYTFQTVVYDLELVSSTGVVSRILEGEIKLSKEVTY